MIDISNTINRYENIINNNKKLYMHGSDSISGYFKNESLEIGINGVDVRFMKEVLSDLEKYAYNLNEIELFRKRKMSELINIEGVDKWLTYYQTIAHESFHLLQSLTLQATSEYVYWFRKFRDYEFMVFAMVLSTKGRWKSSNHKLILDNIESINDIEFKNWIIGTISKNNIRLELMESYSDKSEIISPFELVEGSAVSFQELVTHSVGINIHNFSENGLYTNAYQYFEKNGGCEIESDYTKKVVFLYICYTSLYYGSISKLHSGSKWDNPVTLFTNLCQFSKKYADILAKPTIIYAAYKNFKKINKRGYTYKTKEFLINNISEKYLTSLQDSIEENEFILLSQHINLLLKMRESACVYFSKNNVSYMCNVRKHLDRKMSPLFKHLSDTVPIFGNFYFIAFLLNDIDLSSSFINMVGHNQLSDVIVETSNGKKIENEIDTDFSQCMNDFKDYLQTGAAYCCKKHGFTSRKRDMVYCTESDSLRRRIKMFGKDIELKDTVIFN